MNVQLDWLEVHESKNADYLDQAQGEILKALDIHTRLFADQIEFRLIPEAKRNVIGAAFCSLVRSKQIFKTGQFRNSTKPGQNGRIVWEYRHV